MSLEPLKTIIPDVVPNGALQPLPSDAIALLTPQALEQQIAVESMKRKLITQFITDHMIEGVDYGKIHIAKNCPTRYQCQNAYHFSKDVLFKPGAEKFCSLFRLRAEFARDDDTWEMMGKPVGLVCYICRLYTVQGVLVGEGRGAASVEEKGLPNTAIKIGEKRSKLDAVLSTGGLSDFFTQDLEEMDEEPPKEPSKSHPQQKPQSSGRDESPEAKKRRYLYTLATEVGLDKSESKAWLQIQSGKESSTELTFQELDALITLLKGKEYGPVCQQAVQAVYLLAEQHGVPKPAVNAWLDARAPENDEIPITTYAELAKLIRTEPETFLAKEEPEKKPKKAKQ